MTQDLPSHELAVMAEQCTGRGARGVVTAAAPLAAQAGATVLREGGNAYDAAVAMCLAEGVLLPPKCGLGGDLVALHLPAAATARPSAPAFVGPAGPTPSGGSAGATGPLADAGRTGQAGTPAQATGGAAGTLAGTGDAGGEAGKRAGTGDAGGAAGKRAGTGDAGGATGTPAGTGDAGGEAGKRAGTGGGGVGEGLGGLSVPEALVAVGGAAAGLAEVARAGGWRDVGATSVGPPAGPAGLLALAARGRLPLERLAAPALELARGGFPWASVATELSRASVDLVAEMHPEGCTYLPGGRPIEPGTVVRLPRLADAIDELVARRHDVFAGPLGEAIVGAVRSRGGVLTGDDLASFARAEWMPCAEGTAGPYRAWTTPAPTHGPALLDAVAKAGPDADAADAYRRVIAAVEMARTTLSDAGGTSMVTAADADGNVVVVLHSNSYPRFGSGIVVPEYDLVLNNRAGRGFAPVPGHPNFPSAGRRPATTLHAWVVADESGRPRLAGGTPGGDNQLPWNAQTLGQVVASCWRPGLLVTSPRWEWVPKDDGVRAEAGFPDAELEGLAAAAPRLVRRPRWALKSAQQVTRIPRPGEPFEAAADPRTVGAALGV